MKLVIDINHTKLLLTPDQVDALVSLLHGCERIESKYTGSKVNGSEYLDLIKPANIREVIKLGVMSDVEYDAMVFITKQQAT